MQENKITKEKNNTKKKKDSLGIEAGVWPPEAEMIGFKVWLVVYLYYIERPGLEKPNQTKQTNKQK